jgi:hypothetical protein
VPCKKCGFPLTDAAAQQSLAVLEQLAKLIRNRRPRQWAKSYGPLCEACVAALRKSLLG